MRTCVFSILFTVIGLLAGCSTPTSHVSASASGSDAALRSELQQTQAQLDQLKQQVRALEQSNAELRNEVRMLQQEPHPRYPQTNQVPRLTPLQTQ
jgi:uncharacterized protein YlxW (UPF0749 family)